MSEYITIKENREFSRIYKKGKSFVSPVLVTYILKNRSNNLRYGITTGKKTGNAVKRSRSRRVIRASYYQLFSELKPGYDFVFVARGKTPYVKSQVVYAAMRKHMKEAGILQQTDR
jgi:ribonuclease P protein component